MNEKDVLNFGIILVIIRWVAIISFWRNQDTLRNIGFLLVAYSSNNSNYGFSAVVLTEFIYSLPQFLLALIIFQRRFERHPSFSSMTQYSKLFIARFVLSSANLAFFYLAIEGHSSIDSYFFLYILVVFSILVLTLLMIIPILRLPSISLFRKIKISFVLWIVIAYLLNFYLGTVVANSLYSTSSLFFGLSSMFELIFLYYITQFLLTEHKPEYFVNSLYPNSERMVDIGNETEDLIKKPQYSHSNE